MGFSAILQVIFLFSLLIISEGLIKQVLSSSSYPPPSIFNSVSYYSTQNIAVAYGGTNSKISDIYSSFHYFDFQSLSWNEIIPKSSFVPPKLYSSISFVYNNSYYLMFGRTENQISSQTYRFDFKSYEWKIQELKGYNTDVTAEFAYDIFEYEGKNLLAVHGGATFEGQSSELYL